MKIRQGFVTNSSSSSFVIAYKKEEYSEEEIAKYPILKFYDYILDHIASLKGEDWYDSDGYVLKTEEDVKTHYARCWGDEEDIEHFDPTKMPSYELEEYEMIMNAIKDGKYVVLKEVEYHDDVTNKFISEILNDNHFELLSKND